MGSSSRRGFLKRLLGVVPALGAVGSGAARLGPGQVQPSAPSGSEGTGTLEALGELVLPTGELGADGLATALAGFRRWSSGFEPVAELDHPYLWSDDLRHGPPDPRAEWQAQLTVLDSESRRRYGTSFSALNLDSRLELLRRQLPSELPERLPHASEAPHVAIALAAWFFATPAANDLCYGARIGRHECRGLPTLGESPKPLDDAPAGAKRESR